jgi:hypothetical protein
MSVASLREGGERRDWAFRPLRQGEVGLLANCKGGTAAYDGRVAMVEA